MAKQEKKEVRIGYRIIKINTTKFSFEDISEDELNVLFNENSEQVVFDTSAQINILENESTVELLIFTLLRETETQKTLIEHICKTTFFVDGLNSTFDKESESFDLPKGFVQQIFALSYNHARALLSVELSPTIYKDKFFIPVIDISKLELNPKVTKKN